MVASVVDGMGRCVGRLATGSWLGPSSEFAVKNNPRLNRLLSRRITATRYDRLADYAAASSLLHCTDAWSYLGRAGNAFATGLFPEAAHLAYYSEMRSTLAILATSGVVVDAKNCYSLMGGRVEHIFDGGLHQTIWILLNEWSNTLGGTDAVGEELQIENVVLKDWLDSRFGSGNTSSTITGLVREWGVDLESLSNDRMLRNIASYQPGRFDHPKTTPLGSASRDNHLRAVRNLLSEIAHLVEPNTRGTFPNMDLMLLMQALVKGGGVGTTGALATSLNILTPSLAELKVLAIDVLGPGSRTDLVASKLHQLSKERTSVVHLASVSPPPSYPVSLNDLHGMLGRATILARLSTGCVSRVQTLAGINFSDMSIWANNIGLDLGFWDPSPRPTPFTDMWGDLRDSMDDLIVDLSPTLQILNLNTVSSIAALTGLTRTALWSLSA